MSHYHRQHPDEPHPFAHELRYESGDEREEITPWHLSQAESLARAFPLETEQRAFLVCQKKGCEVLKRIEVYGTDSLAVMEQFAHFADSENGLYVTVEKA